MYSHPFISLSSSSIVHRCIVHGCSVHGCSVHECIVHGCIVHKCSIHRCIVKCTMYTDASYTYTSYTDALYMEASLNQTWVLQSCTISCPDSFSFGKPRKTGCCFPKGRYSTKDIFLLPSVLNVSIHLWIPAPISYPFNISSNILGCTRTFGKIVHFIVGKISQSNYE